MSPQWRPKIMAWFDQLGDSFQLKAETLAMATNYLDRYLSRRSCGNVSFQLASIASIFLASKIEETRPFRTSDFVTLSDGLFTASDLRLMELELLCTLKWHLNPPTVHAAAQRTEPRQSKTPGRLASALGAVEAKAVPKTSTSMEA